MNLDEKWLRGQAQLDYHFTTDAEYLQWRNCTTGVGQYWEMTEVWDAGIGRSRLVGKPRQREEIA
jgi:hypothetical protein